MPGKAAPHQLSEDLHSGKAYHIWVATPAATAIWVPMQSYESIQNYKLSLIDHLDRSGILPPPPERAE